MCDRFTPLHYALSPWATDSLIKLVIDSASRRILGVHMVGDSVAEIIQALVPALKKGLTVDELTETIGIPPTSGEELFSMAGF